MTAHIKPLGIIKSYVGGKAKVVVDAGNTVRETMKQLGVPPELVALVLVNDKHESKDYLVRDGDVVMLMAVVGGG
jgi:sulfur carrier protein ThiS